jgi:hypothetical protein
MPQTISLFGFKCRSRKRKLSGEFGRFFRGKIRISFGRNI